MGTTLREIVFEVGGGMRGGADFKAVQIGGPSGGCLTEKDLDLPLDFDSLSAAASRRKTLTSRSTSTRFLPRAR